MDAHLGSPTWFVTNSVREYEWDDVDASLQKRHDQSYPAGKKMTRNALIANGSDCFDLSLSLSLCLWFRFALISSCVCVLLLFQTQLVWRFSSSDGLTRCSSLCCVPRMVDHWERCYITGRLAWQFHCGYIILWLMLVLFLLLQFYFIFVYCVCTCRYRLEYQRRGTPHVRLIYLRLFSLLLCSSYLCPICKCLCFTGAHEAVGRGCATV